MRSRRSSRWTTSGDGSRVQALDTPQHQIPNRFIFVWIGRSFPYFCRLAVESALLADDQAAVELHLYDETPNGDPHFEAVRRYRRVAVRAVDLDPCFDGLQAPASAYRDLLEAIPSANRSAKSNLIRYGLLHSRGGVYLDFDVLVLRDFRHLRHHPAFIGEERVFRVESAKVEGRREAWMIAPTLAYVYTYGLRWLDAHVLGGRGLVEPISRPLDRVWSKPNLNNAVIGACAGNGFIERLLAAALQSSPTIRYHLGPTLVSRVYDEADNDVVRLPSAVFFSQPPSYSFRFFAGRPPTVPDDAVLLHYVSSNHGRLLRNLTMESLATGRRKALFYRVARSVAERAADLPRG